MLASSIRAVIGLVGEVGPNDPGASRLLRPSAVPVMVDDDLGTLLRKQPDARRADSPRPSGDEHAPAFETCPHPPKKSLPICGNVR